MIETFQSVIKNNFYSMYNTFSKKGILTDQFQQDNGISVDTNYTEQEVFHRSEC